MDQLANKSCNKNLKSNLMEYRMTIETKITDHAQPR